MKKVSMVLPLLLLTVSIPVFSEIKSKPSSSNSNVAGVFIDQNNPTKIVGKSARGSIIQLLSIGQLPKKTTIPKGFNLYNKSFKDAKLSPDRKRVAFSVACDGHEWSGLYDLQTKKVEQLSFYYDSFSGKVYWSKNGKYIIEEVEGADEYKLLITNIVDKNIKYHIGPSSVLKENELEALANSTDNYKDGKDLVNSVEINFLEWENENKPVKVKLTQKTELLGIKETPKLIEEKEIGIWSVDIFTKKATKIK